MRTYHTDEIVFDVPDDWIDRSMNIFVSSAGDQAPFNVVITRDKLGDLELRAFVIQKLKDFSKHIPRFNMLGQRQRAVGPLQGLEARLQWPVQGGGTMYQHQIYVAYYGEILIFTASSMLKLAAQCDTYLEQILSNIKFRRQ